MVQDVSPDKVTAADDWSADLVTRTGFRFHVRPVRPTEVDHDRTEDFLAFGEDGTTVIASAMLAADAALERAEVAISIRADYKKRGISWTLLEHVARFARAKGIRTLESIESHDNREAIELEREMGFTVTPYPGDPTLSLVRKTLTPD